MNCPVCDAKLRAVEKYGVEVDVCPDCKGVWLDRGELDKILEMAATDGPVQRIAQDRPAERPRIYEDEHRRREDDHNRRHPERESDHNYGHGGHQKRRGSWLGEILGSFGGED